MIEDVIEIETFEEFQLNGSLLVHEGGTLIIFRQTIDKGYYYGRIKLGFLNKNWNFISPPVYVNVPGKPEDPRIFKFQEEIYITYTRLESDQLFHHYMAKLVLDDTAPYVLDEQELRLSTKKQHEKNWMPFVHDSCLYFVHKIIPHSIVQWDTHANKIKSEYVTDASASFGQMYGKPRGGTPPVRLDEGFLAFFHSSIYLSGNSSIRDSPRMYYMGAYLFEANPPFKMIAASQAPIMHDDFYRGRNHVSPHKVVFPMSILKNGENIIVSYGDMDSRIKILVMKTSNILDSLAQIPLTQEIK